MVVECGEQTIGEGALAGRQGRLLFAFLGSRRSHPVSKGDLIDVVWASGSPPSAETALNALVSKVRAALRGLGVPAPHGIVTELGTYQFVLPAAWIDIEEARAALDRAEGALRRGDLVAAWAGANVAAAITRQPFLPDEHDPWVGRQRASLSRVWRRALLVLSSVSTQNQEFELGIQHASDALAAEPFDEIACQALMRAHSAAGNRAEALRVYAACRRLFRDELGAQPSPQTESVFLGILQQ